MNRIRRTVLVTGSALATLVLTLTATFWPGRGAHADAQYAQHASPSHATTTSAGGSASSDASTSKATTQDTGDAAKATPAAAAPTAAGTAPAAAEAATAPAAAETSGDDEPLPLPDASAQTPVMHIKGDYDINQLRRLIELAKDSGFTDSQLRQITVEDEHGNIVNALAFLEASQLAKQREAERLAKERSKVYLTPKDLINELDNKQSKELDRMRDKMVIVK